MMKTKVKAAWGAGKICKNYILSKGNHLNIQCIIDNDLTKDGGLFCGNIPIVHPSKIDDWSLYHIIIMLKNPDNVIKQLKALGLRENIDFFAETDYETYDFFTVEQVQKGIEKIVFKKSSPEFEIRFKTRKEYEKLWIDHVESLEYENALDAFYSLLENKNGKYGGYCAYCKKNVHFLLNYQFVFAGRPAWRESAICPECNCNSRMRYIIDNTLRNIKSKYAYIYIYEYITDTYRALKKQYPNLIGSEFLGSDKECGKLYHGILHEDALNLSFSDQSFDMLISCDVFEHVSDCKKAFSEAYRVLRDKGKLLLTVPLYKDRDETVKRAGLNKDGDIEYYMEPEYHGNPLSDKGSLVFYEYGWDIINFLNEAGFSDVYFILYFSVVKAYFGYLPLVIEAIK